MLDISTINWENNCQINSSFFFFFLGNSDSYGFSLFNNLVNIIIIIFKLSYLHYKVTFIFSSAWDIFSPWVSVYQQTYTRGKELNRVAPNLAQGWGTVQERTISILVFLGMEHCNTGHFSTPLSIRQDMMYRCSCIEKEEIFMVLKSMTLSDPDYYQHQTAQTCVGLFGLGGGMRSTECHSRCAFVPFSCHCVHPCIYYMSDHLEYKCHFLQTREADHYREL